VQLLHRMEYLREEHEGLLDLANRIEKLLESASKSDYAKRLSSLAELRSLAHTLAGVVEHCHAGDRIVESTYYQSLRQYERARVDAEHQQLLHIVASFKEELKFATVDRTMAMILPGMELVNHLRSHISFERDVLGRIVESQDSEKKAAGKKEITRKAHANKRKLAKTQRAHSSAAHPLPCTLEHHPEL